MSEAALELAERALAAASGDDASVIVMNERSGFARFAASEVHQPTLVEDASVQLRIVRDGRAGGASTNRTSDEGLAELARRARAAADSASVDETLPDLPGPSDLPHVEGFDEQTAALGADDQAALAGKVLAEGGDLGMYGYFTSSVCELAVAATTGLRAHQRYTDATVLALAAGEDASGYASATAWRIADLDPAAVAREAVEKAARTSGASSVEPTRFRAVLEPYAVADLMFWFGWAAFTAAGLLEGRSYLTGRLGEKVFDENVSIADDALDARGLPKAFDFDGVPKQRVQLVEDGVARGVVWDLVTAARSPDGERSTGHGLPPAARYFSPLPSAIAIAPGDATADDLVAAVDDGIYVTRLHYLGLVNPREGVITGMTRDGTFRIRDGKIAEPLVNLRFTVAMPELLADVPAVSRDVKLVNQTDFYGERFPIAFLVPGLATGAFNVTGVGSGPGL